jgi:hypothetical protein
MMRSACARSLRFPRATFVARREAARRTRSTLFLIACIACAIIAPLGTVAARTSRTPGFHFQAGLRNAPHPGQPVTLWFSVLTEPDADSTAAGRLTIRVPRGLVTAASETTWTFSAREQQRAYYLTAFPTSPGLYDLHALLTVRRSARDADIGEYVVSLRVTRDTTILLLPRAVREHRVTNGRTYRYAGQVLVPVDSTERVVERDILKPRVLHEEPGVCPSCEMSGADTVALIVLLDKDGRIVDVQLPVSQNKRSDESRDGSSRGTDIQPDPARLLAARQALTRWTFSPATARGRRVPDWLAVRVPLRRGP